MKRNYIILLAALLTVACAGNGDTMSPTPQEGEILFSGSTVGPKVRTSYEDTETALPFVLSLIHILSKWI